MRPKISFSLQSTMSVESEREKQINSQLVRLLSDRDRGAPLAPLETVIKLIYLLIAGTCSRSRKHSCIWAGRQHQSMATPDRRSLSPCCKLQQTCSRTSYQLCARNLLTVTTTCCTPSRTKTSRARLAFGLVKFRAACRLHATNLSGRFRDDASRRPQSWANIEIARDLSLLLW